MSLLIAAILAFTPGIQTPSGNISCLVSHHVLHCAIRSADYHPHCADLDWHGWEMTARGRVQITCSGGILYDPRQGSPAYDTLPYGRTWIDDAFHCNSRRTGLTCRNRGGHTLFVSRESWSRR